MRAALRELHERGDALITRLWNGLREIGHVRLYGPPPGTERTPTIAFTVKGMPSIEVAEKLAERGVFLSHGDFYAMTVVDDWAKLRTALSEPAVPGYTNSEEVDRLVSGVRCLSTTR